MNGEKNPSQVTQLNSGRDKAPLCLSQEAQSFFRLATEACEEREGKINQEIHVELYFL